MFSVNAFQLLDTDDNIVDADNNEAVITEGTEHPIPEININDADEIEWLRLCQQIQIDSWADEI